jgi:hypothetical protein
MENKVFNNLKNLKNAAGLFRKILMLSWKK